VVYQSPSQGEIAFGWEGPLRVRGEEVPITGYPRYDNPWAGVAFEDRDLFVFDPDSRNGLAHNFATGRRTTFRVE
jgi:hypothetical protein